MDMSDLERAEGAFLRVAARPNRHDSGVRYLEEQFVAVRASERAKFESVGAREEREYQEWLRGGQVGECPGGPEAVARVRTMESERWEWEGRPSLFKTPLDHRCTFSDHEEILAAIKDLKEGVLIDRMGPSALSARIRKMQEERARRAAGQVAADTTQERLDASSADETESEEATMDRLEGDVTRDHRLRRECAEIARTEATHVVALASSGLSKAPTASPELRKAKDELTDDEASELSRVLERERRRVERQERIAETADYVQVEPLQKPVPYETKTVAVEEDGAVNWQMPPGEPEAPFLEMLAKHMEGLVEHMEEEVAELNGLLGRLGTGTRLPEVTPMPESSEVRADSLFVRLGALRWRIDGAVKDLRTLVVIFEKEVG